MLQSTEMRLERVKIMLNFITPAAPCVVFTPKPDESILVRLREAVTLGLLRSIAGPTATSGHNLWLECLVLTDVAGRVACGLEPLGMAAPKAVDPHRSLFD